MCFGLFRVRFLAKTSIKNGLFKQQTEDASNARAVKRAYPNNWFIIQKAHEIRFDRKLAHGFDASQWRRLA
jgi:hypothetical protein